MFLNKSFFFQVPHFQLHPWKCLINNAMYIFIREVAIWITICSVLLESKQVRRVWTLSKQIPSNRQVSIYLKVWVNSVKITSNTILRKNSSSSTYQVVKRHFYSTNQQKKKWIYGTLKFHQNVVVKALPGSLQKPPSKPCPNLTQKFYCPVHIYNIFTLNIQTNSKILQTFRDLESIINIAFIHNQTSKPIIAPFEIFPGNLWSLWRILDHDKIISGCGWCTFQTEKKMTRKY